MVATALGALAALAALSALLAVVSGAAAGAAVWDCARPWPELELFLPVNLEGSRSDEWKIMFLRSYMFHWPVEVAKTKLLFIVDEEQRGPAVNDLMNYVDQFDKVRNTSRVAFNKPDPLVYNHLGHNRQQLLMFWADNFTSSEFVGFADTDTLFVTYVDREDIFEDGKPVVNGKIGDMNAKGNRDGLWHDMAATTFDVLGVLEPMKCMSYFPVVIKTRHLALLRAHLERRHGMAFDEVFRTKIVLRRFSQFNFFCTYLFAFHRDEYTWYTHMVTPGWDGANPPPIYGQNGNMSLYSSKMLEHKPLVAVHARYHTPKIVTKGHYDMLRLVMQGGFCFSPPFPKPDIPLFQGCRFLSSEEDHRTEIYDEMFKFEWSNYITTSPRSHLQDMSYRRFQRIRHCNHTYSTELEVFEQVMAFKPNLNNGDVLYAVETGRQVWAFENNTRFEFENYDAFVGLGYANNRKMRISLRELHNIPLAGTLHAPA